ncbi:MAG TPA: kelch repeat-containing protein [Chloroflexota bacterium]|nr:kelch repeat-containing protein [Chloroflexota bacterium]
MVTWKAIARATLTLAAGATLVLAGTLGPSSAQGSWSERAPLLLPRSETAIAALGDSIYVMGGYGGDRHNSDVVQVYDSRTDTWTYGPSLPMPIHHAMPAVVAGRLFLIGGEVGGTGTPVDPSTFTDTVFELDPAAGAWLLRAPLPVPRSAGAVGIIDGIVYVAGGRPPHGHEFAAYDPVADAWTTLPDLPTQRNHLAAGVIDGKLYVVGGRFGGGVGSEMTATVEVYDPATQTWQAGTPLPEPRAGLTGTVVNDCLYAIGGEGNDADPRGIFDLNEVYNPRTDSWTRVAPPPLPIHGLNGVPVLNGDLYIAGGATKRGVSGEDVSLRLQVFHPDLDCR